MSFADTMENKLLLLVLNGTAWANMADNAASSPYTNIYVSLHTADPGDAGNQTTSECAYTSYARVAVARSGSGWTVTAGSASPAANIDFPACTGGTETATYWAIGTASSGAGILLGSGALSGGNISIATGVTPRVTTASTITLS